jgi:hypothetical protein
LVKETLGDERRSWRVRGETVPKRAGVQVLDLTRRDFPGDVGRVWHEIMFI